jgi:hypothetical protein
MTEELLYKLIDHEIQWLSYYGLREDRELLNENSNIYKDVRSIGYTKRVIELSLRCSPGLITSYTPITKETKIEDLKQDFFPRGENKFTPLEVFFIIFPERKKEMIERLIPEKIEHRVFYDKKMIKNAEN